MVKSRKGVGYAIEAFIASLVIFIFVLGGLTTSPSERDWSRFQDKVGANDISYVMQETGYTDEMVKKGQTGSIKTAFSAITGEKLQVSGSLDQTSAGSSKVGFYALDSKIITENLTAVSNGDRCYNELEEISSEYPVLRTTNESGSLEDNYGVRIYLSDSDPRSGSGYNGDEDYDTIWIDRGIECQFSSSEGPISDRTLFEWNNNPSNNPNRFFDFREVSGISDKKIVLFNATLAGEITKELRNRETIKNTKFVMDSFNFSKSSLTDYEILIFRGKNSLNDLHQNHNRILEYNRQGSVFVASNLNSTDLENNNYLNSTGLKWVNLSYSGPENPEFTELDSSERLNHYFNSIGCDGCMPFSMNSGGKISSSNNQNYISGASLFSDSNTVYDTDKWNVVNNSMKRMSAPIGAPNSNCPPVAKSSHSSGIFEFPASSGETEEFEVWNTKLGTKPSNCDGTKAISVDLDKDGDLDESDEGLYYDNSVLSINNRRYNISIESYNKVSFIYDGPQKVEYVNYRTTFPSQDIEKFARIGNLTQNGDLGGPDNQQIVLTTALMHWMAEDEATFGNTQDSEITHQTVGNYGNKPKIPYKLYLRWSR